MESETQLPSSPSAISAAPLSASPLDPQAFHWRPADEGGPPVLWVMGCALGPVPLGATAAARAFMDVEARPWTLDWEGHFIGLPRRVREHGARVLGVAGEDLSLVSTTTAGLVTLARGLPWSPWDEVLTPLGEFPTNAWPWRVLESQGVQLREVPLWPGHRAGHEAWASTPPPPDVDPEARLLEALGPSTRLLSVSWVRFQDGLRLDLERLAAGCQERGVLLVVDGIQGAGTAPPPLRGVSAFATGGHKHLLAPQGLGLLWTDPALRQRLVPPGGWLSVEGATDFDRPSTDYQRSFQPTGEALEEGVPNLVGAAALAGSLELLADAGMATLEAHIDAVSAQLLARLGSHPRWHSVARRAELRRLETLRQRGRLGPIVALHHRALGDGGQKALQELLEGGFDEGIYASVREGYLRLSFHGWHRETDVDRLVDWLGRSS